MIMRKMNITPMMIILVGLVALLPFKAFADQYYVVTGQYLAITETPKASSDISHEDYIELENELARGIDGIVKQDGYAYPLSDRHPVAPHIRFTEPYCRMVVPQDHSYFFITPFNEQPDLFSAPAYVRFRCTIVED